MNTPENTPRNMPENTPDATGEYVIRPATPDDAPALLTLGRQILEETDYFVRSPEERAPNERLMRQLIEHYQALPSSLLLHAWAGKLPVGEAILRPGQLLRTAHNAELGVGVLRGWWGRGIARALMRALEAHARQHRLHRLELSVFSNNPRARAFYLAQGYQPEGIKRRSVLIRGTFIDEEIMAKLVPAETGNPAHASDNKNIKKPF